MTGSWVLLLAGTWLWGGAFLPRQAAAAALVAAAAATGTLFLSPGSWNRGERMLLVWIGWSALGLALVRRDPMDGVERLAIWTIAVIMLHAARTLPVSRREPVVLNAAAVAVAAAAVGEWIGFGVPRTAGVFDNPNVLAMLLVPILPVLATQPWPRWIRFPLLAAVLAGVAVTGSRAGLLAVLVVLFLATRARFRRFWPLLLLGAAALLAWRAAAWPDPLAWRRPAIWQATLRLAARSPVSGSTAGGFDEAILPYRLPEPGAVGRWTKRPGNAESTPLQVLAETGIPGAVLLLSGLAILFADRRKDGPLPVAARATLGAMCTLALVHDVMGIAVILWTWSWLAGRALHREGSTSPGPAAARESTPLRLLGAVSVLLLVLWALAAPEAGRSLLEPDTRGGRTDAVERLAPLWAEPHVRTALRSLDEPAWGWSEAAEGTAAAERAVALHRGSPRAWRTLAFCLARAVRELTAAPGTIRRAEEAFARATALDPHHPWTWLEWSRLERARGDLVRAGALARRAVSEEPSLVSGWLLLSRIALDQGRLADARDALERARTARARGRGHVLGSYERSLLTAPDWQFRQIEEQLP